MNVYRISVDTLLEFEGYKGFIVTAESIKEALEIIYKNVVKPDNDIPYYLRSSNMKIEKLGILTDFEEKDRNTILLSDYRKDD